MKNRINVIDWIQKNKKYVIVFILLFLTLIQVYYTDTRSTTRQGILFWEALFSGRFFQYYSINLQAKQNGLMLHEANYDMVLNFLMGVWQLPLYIIEKITGCGDIINFFSARVYSKIYLLLLVWISGLEMRKIGKSLGADEQDQEHIFFMFVTSAFVITSALVNSQVDIIGVFITLKALYHALENNNKKYFFYFLCAVQCKNFAAFLFLPVIIIKERNVIRIAVIEMVPLALSALVNLPFKLADPAGTAPKTERLAFMIQEMLERKIWLFGYQVPVFFVLVIAGWLLAWFIKVPEEKKKEYMIYFGYLGTLLFFIGMSTSAYWFIYFAPYLTLLFFMRKDRRQDRLFLEVICCAAMAVGYVFCKYWQFSGVEVMLMGQLMPGRDFIHLEELWEKYGHASYYMAWTVTYAIFAVWSVGAAIYHCPYRKYGDKTETEVAKEPIGKGLWLRMAINILINCAQVLLCMIGRR